MERDGFKKLVDFSFPLFAVIFSFYYWSRATELGMGDHRIMLVIATTFGLASLYILLPQKTSWQMRFAAMFGMGGLILTAFSAITWP